MYRWVSRHVFMEPCHIGIDKARSDYDHLRNRLLCRTQQAQRPRHLQSAAFPCALMFLISENAHKDLSTVHALSVQAASTVSSKTVGIIDIMI